jgi:hypothetical protein
VLISPIARVQSALDKVENKINFKKILDFNFIQHCLNEQRVFDETPYVIYDPKMDDKLLKSQFGPH